MKPSGQNNGKILFYFFIICYLISNPLFYSILLRYLYNNNVSDIGAFALGLYLMGWIMVGIYFIIYPIFFKKKEEVKIRTTDEIIDDCWKEHNKEIEDARS